MDQDTADVTQTEAPQAAAGSIDPEDVLEALRDVVLRLCPLLDTDADEMIHEVKLFELLKGIRGQAPRDLTAIADVVLRVSQLAVRHPRIAEMDINQLLALEAGVVAVDGRMQLVAPGVANHTESRLSH